MHTTVWDSAKVRLARISGLFSGKSYNLDSLIVGVTEGSTISRMTISLTSDDRTFEQIKKQLGRSVEIIKVVDYTDTPVHKKEILFVKVNHCSDADITELFRISKVFGVAIIKALNSFWYEKRAMLQFQGSAV